jgi:hypothetical protein
MCLLFLGIRFGAETSIAFPTRLNMLSISIRSVYDSGLLRSRYVMIMCTYKCKKNHELARRISPTTSASVIPSRVFWKPSCARFRTDDMHPLILRLIGHLLCTG